MQRETVQVGVYVKLKLNNQTKKYIYNEKAKS